MTNLKEKIVMGDNVPKELLQFREQIDALDVELINVLVRRFEVVRAVAEFKAGSDLSVVQPARAEEVKQRAVDMAVEQGLDGPFVRSLYDAMVDYAHVLEHEIIDRIKASGE